MSYYVAPFTFRFDLGLIDVDGGTGDVDCADLYTAIKEAQASEEGIIYDPIGKGSGLNELSIGVKVGLTVELLGAWQLRFTAGNYIARVAGGNLIGGPSGDPIAYSAGVQTLLIQSAASTVVDSTANDPWGQVIESGLTAAEVMRIILAVNAGRTSVAGSSIKFKSQDGLTDRVSATMAGKERTTVTVEGD